MFNADITKQAQDVVFSLLTVKPFRSQVFFNEVPVKRSVFQKYLGFHLDQKFDFNLNALMKKCLKHKKKYQSLENFTKYCQVMRF